MEEKECKMAHFLAECSYHVAWLTRNSTFFYFVFRHTFCRGCILQALEVSPGCPLCRTTIDPSALYEVIALSRICDELPVYCPHKTLGCNHTCQRIQLGKHLKDDCVYIGTLCRVEECRKKLLKKDLSEHMESCPYKRVECLMCHAKVQKSQLSVCVCVPLVMLDKCCI